MHLKGSKLSFSSNLSLRRIVTVKLIEIYSILIPTVNLTASGWCQTFFYFFFAFCHHRAPLHLSIILPLLTNHSHTTHQVPYRAASAPTHPKRSKRSDNLLLLTSTQEHAEILIAAGSTLRLIIRCRLSGSEVTATMQVNAHINQGAAVLGQIIPQKSVDDHFTRALLVHTSELIVKQSRDDVDLIVKEKEVRADEHLLERCVEEENRYDKECSSSPEEEGDDDDHTYDWQNVMEQISMDPSLARVGREGVLPLHAACGASAPINVIKMLLQIYPEAAQAKSDSGYTPIMCYLLLNTDSPSEKIVSALLESYPRAAAVADDNNQLPIHAACMAAGVSKDIFTMLLRAYPGGAYVCDIDGFYPVDYAAGNKDADTRKLALASLIANDPEEIRGHYTEEKEEKTGVIAMNDADLNLLLSRPVDEKTTSKVNLTDDIIQDILTSFTFSDESQEAPQLMRATSAELASISSVVDEKSLHLHLVQCLEKGSSPSQSIVTTLLESYPNAGCVANVKNQLPIHLACKAVDVSKKVFTAILRAYPQGAYFRDVEGLCPIDYAVSNNDMTTRKNAVAALAASDKVNKQTQESSSTNVPNDTVSPQPSKSLIQEEEETAAVEKTLLHHLEHCIAHDGSPSKAIVTKIIETYPSSVRVTNPKNQLPIHLACMARDVSENILSLLLHTYPEGAFVSDGRGMCPIDYAVSNSDLTTRKNAIAALLHNDSMVRFMRDSSAPVKIPGSFFSSCCVCGNMDDVGDEEVDEFNADALEDVLAYWNTSLTEGTIESAIDSDPRVVHIFDANGQLPIHHACMAERVSANTFAYILDAYPEGAYVPDKFGKYPIDYAAENKDAETRMNAFAALLQNDATRGLDPKKIEGQGCISACGL